MSTLRDKMCSCVRQSALEGWTVAGYGISRSVDTISSNPSVSCYVTESGWDAQEWMWRQDNELSDGHVPVDLFENIY